MSGRQPWAWPNASWPWPIQQFSSPCEMAVPEVVTWPAGVGHPFLGQTSLHLLPTALQQSCHSPSGTYFRLGSLITDLVRFNGVKKKKKIKSKKQRVNNISCDSYNTSDILTPKSIGGSTPGSQQFMNQRPKTIFNWVERHFRVNLQVFVEVEILETTCSLTGCVCSNN